MCEEYEKIVRPIHLKPFLYFSYLIWWKENERGQEFLGNFSFKFDTCIYPVKLSTWNLFRNGWQKIA